MIDTDGILWLRISHAFAERDLVTHAENPELWTQDFQDRAARATHRQTRRSYSSRSPYPNFCDHSGFVMASQIACGLALMKMR